MLTGSTADRSSTNLGKMLSDKLFKDKSQKLIDARECLRAFDAILPALKGLCDVYPFWSLSLAHVWQVKLAARENPAITIDKGPLELLTKAGPACIAVPISRYLSPIVANIRTDAATIFDPSRERYKAFKRCSGWRAGG